MSDDSKDNNNDNVDNSANNPTSNQPSVKVTDLTPNKGALVGNKTDIQNP